MFRTIGLVLFVTLLSGSAEAQQKKRVAVMNFDYATVQSGVAALFGANQDIGKGIADLLVDKLVKDGDLLRHRAQATRQDPRGTELLQQRSRRPESAPPRSAKVLGVDAIIVGSITQFGRDDKKTDVGGGALGGVTGRFGIGGVRKIQIHGRGPDHRAHDRHQHGGDPGQRHGARTRRSREGTGIIGSGGSYAGMAGGALDMKASNFADTILGEAITKTVADLARQTGVKGGIAAHRRRCPRSTAWWPTFRRTAL